ncbi:carboxypeptidase-like regulatory domain-containing protein [Ferruginibacter sp.]|nr:carboxypeptidase-like regulatory domain-containing protein [Ferruginibacter sp.]
MFEKENHINYTAEDIQQYLSGKLTPLQMNAMEKAALTDPFLAEAIEGYESMQQEDWKKQLAELKEGFSQQKNTTAKVIALPRKTNWFKYAAAVLLIGGTATISYWLINKKEDQQQIAQTVKTTSASDSIQPAATNKEVIADSQKANTTGVTVPVDNNFATIDKNADAVTEKIKPDSNFIYKPAVQTPAEFAKLNDGKIREDVVVNQQTTSAANAATPPATSNTVKEGFYNKTATRQEELKKTDAVEMREKAGSKDEQQLNRNFIAQVVGPDNTPLPFANISIKSENFGAYADVQGNFRLVSPDSLLTVEIRSAGYQPKSYTLKSDVAQNKIVLAEDNLAFKQKTVVSGSTAARSVVSRRATLLKDSVINVEPADGWDNYNTYVDNNIEIPDDILTKNIHGQVELSFDVKSNGSITNIKVDKSLCNNCDEVAKRLIEQGPQWKVKKGRKGRGKITVQF